MTAFDKIHLTTEGWRNRKSVKTENRFRPVSVSREARSRNEKCFISQLRPLSKMLVTILPTALVDRNGLFYFARLAVDRLHGIHGRVPRLLFELSVFVKAV